MKTFKDLVFKNHQYFEWMHGLCFFDNGYWVSVVRFKLFWWMYGSYTDNEKEWELAVIKGNSSSWEICYSTSITDDVIWHLSTRKVTDIMKKIQKLY